MKLTTNKVATFKKSGNDYQMSFYFTDEDQKVHTLEKCYSEKCSKVSELEIKLILDLIRSLCIAEGNEEKFINDLKVSDRDFRNKSKWIGAKINTRIRYEFEATYARCVWVILKKYGYNIIHS